MSGEKPEDSSREVADVLVIGAGMAGLAAARELAERGLHTLVLEARDRVGGRIHSLQTSEGIVELGAEFVHGRDPKLWEIIDEAGAETVERDGAMLREDAGGELTEENDAAAGESDSLTDLAHLPDDMSFAEWLASSDLPKEHHRALLGYVEGFNAADANRISARALGVQQQAEDAIEGDRVWHLRGGYSQLTTYLANRVRAARGEVRLSCVVRSVRWSAGEVAVDTSTGVYRARRCIVTLPLGVLQIANREGGIRFDPEPKAIAQARRLAMGSAERFTMVFRERWWEQSKHVNEKALRAMSFLLTYRRSPPVWWTRHPEPEALAALTGWAGGPRAAELIGRSEEELGEQACRELAQVFELPEQLVRDALIATHRNDWQLDPFSRGAYTYVPVDTIDAPLRMTEPEAGTLFFAGEHTDTTGNWGTVHAALRTGLRAAEQVFSASRLKR
ncbi:MAG TPA: NAD(P)/FAD-dependent oxidoreductase [Bryocella sp.]|nr:NAD(P)/FAD-dependent oxidoreductase [Bryocella sp.]